MCYVYVAICMYCTSVHASKKQNMYVDINSVLSINIKTHGSESRGQEEAGLRDEPVSYLQVAPL